MRFLIEHLFKSLLHLHDFDTSYETLYVLLNLHHHNNFEFFSSSKQISHILSSLSV